MKRWAWVLAVPYVVVFANHGKDWFSTSDQWVVEDKETYAITLCHSKDTCEDLSSALNEAHEKRENERLSKTYRKMLKQNCEAGGGEWLTYDSGRESCWYGWINQK